MVEFLLGHGYILNPDRHLDAAAQTGKCDIFNLILENTPDEYTADIFTCYNPLEIACQHGYSDIVALILSRHPDAASPDHFLHACHHGHLDIIRQFIDSDMDLDFVDLVAVEGVEGPIGEVLYAWGRGRRTDINAENKDAVLAILMDIDEFAQEIVVGATSIFFWEIAGRGGTAALMERLADTYSRETAKAAEADPAVEADEDSELDAYMVEALRSSCEGGNIGVARHLFASLKHARREVIYELLLRSAADGRCQEAFRLALSSLGIDVNAQAGTAAGATAEAASGTAAATPDAASLGYDPGVVLFHAAKCGCEDVVTALLAHPACGPSRINSLHQVTLAAGQYSAKRLNCFSGTALAAASDPAIVKRLLDSKADVNPAGGVSVFATSAARYQVEAVRLLHEAGASVACAEAGVPERLTLTEVWLRAASSSRTAEDHEAVLELLLEAGMRTRGLSQGMTALTACAGSYDICQAEPLMRALLAHDPALLEEPDGCGMAPMLVASRCSSLQSRMMFLLRAGADPLVYDDFGLTALHWLWDEFAFPHWNDDRKECDNSDEFINKAIHDAVHAILTRAQPVIGSTGVGDGGACDGLEQPRKRQRTEAAQGGVERGD
jgi:ankyrin repeat protein